MTNQPLERDIIIVRLNGIEGELMELQQLAKLAKEHFTTGDGHKLAQYHLHRALEGVFNIASHILSRYPGIQAAQYKELAIKLGEKGIVETQFANTKLTEMAKYRNRLVHFYAQVTPDEIYSVLQNDLPDFETFLSAIKKVLSDPAPYSLTVE